MINCDEEIFIVSEEDYNEIFIKAKVNRRQLVKSIYLGFLNFANSNKFISKEWEIEYMSERLCKIFNTDENTLIQELINLNKHDLGKLFFNANPIYTISYPNAKNKDEELEMFIKNSIAKDKTSNDFKRIKTPEEWNIPEDYNFWTTDKKRDFIIQCFNEITSSFDGMKIEDFRSTLIEKFIGEK